MSPSATTLTFKQQKLAECDAKTAEIKLQISNYEAHNDPKEQERINRKCENAVKSIGLTADSTEMSLIQMGDAQHHQEEQTRAVQAETGVYRPPYQPDLLIVFVTLVVCGLIETIFTAFTIVADGAAGPIAALATGLTTTSVNIGLGCFSGWASRYIGMGANKPIRKKSEYIKHCLGLGVSATALLGAAFMSFGASRVRAVGDHKGILDFDAVSFFATYNDHLSLATSAIGLLVTGVSFLKGRNSLGDKIPQLAELARHLKNDTDHDVTEIIENALDSVDKTLADVETVVAISAPLADEESAVEAAIIRHISEVQTAKEECLTVHQQEHERECFILGRNIPLPELDLGEFNALLDGLTVKARFKPNEDALEAVRVAHSQATTKILQAHADYLANRQSYRVPPPNQPTTL